MAGRITAGPGRRLVVPVAVGVVGLTLITLGQIVPNRHAIEDDLTSRSSEALKSADLVGLSVSFSGRDATITGAGSTELANQAKDVVSTVDGVRVARPISPPMQLRLKPQRRPKHPPRQLLPLKRRLRRKPLPRPRRRSR